MNIRNARPEDAQMLTDLALRSKRAWGYSEAFMTAVMPDMIVHERYLTEEHGFVAEERGVPIGYAIVRIDNEDAYLRDLFIEPSHFKKGVGSALFHHASDVARANGARTLTLCGDPNAIGFYERLGMSAVGEEPSIAGNGRMLPIMQINLTQPVSS